MSFPITLQMEQYDYIPFKMGRGDHKVNLNWGLGTWF